MASVRPLVQLLLKLCGDVQRVCPSHSRILLLSVLTDKLSFGEMNDLIGLDSLCVPLCLMAEPL